MGRNLFIISMRNQAHVKLNPYPNKRNHRSPTSSAREIKQKELPPMFLKTIY